MSLVGIARASRRERLLRRLDEFNRAYPWSHNDHYRSWVLRSVPHGAHAVLDVGCGTGNLVRALASTVDSVRGIDSDEATVRLAEERLRDLDNVTVSCEDFATLSAAPSYDAITAVAVVHHLPLQETLAQMRAMLRPGGRVIIVGCYREETAADRVVSTAALLANPILGFLKRRDAAESRVAMSAPTTEPVLGLDEIRAIAADVLPGSTVRRKLFWRYGLVYRHPGQAAVRGEVDGLARRRPRG
nr:class I SAM-dependent methyltransferase [Demequina salsinemoris]